MCGLDYIARAELPVNWWTILDRLTLVYTYLDSSGGDDGGSTSATLAGFFADKDLWKPFATEWMEILENHKVPTCPVYNIPYWHSREAIHGNKLYTGWKPDRVRALVIDLLQTINHVPEDAMLAFGVTVRMDDFRRLRQEIPAIRDANYKQLMVDVALCNLLTESRRRGTELKDVFWVFDQNDPFEPVMRKRFQSGPKLQHIKPVIFPDNFRKALALQGSDLLAWSLNRYHHDRKGFGWLNLAAGPMHVINLRHSYFDYAAMREIIDDGGNYVDGATPGHTYRRGVSRIERVARAVLGYRVQL